MPTTYTHTIKFYVAEGNFSLIHFQTAEQFQQNLLNEKIYIICANDTDAIAMHSDFYADVCDAESYNIDMNKFADEYDRQFNAVWDNYFTP